MPYSQLSLDDLCVQLAVLLDDENELYWTRTEKIYAVWEALRIWGALTYYWRSRGTFDVGPAAAYYDLSVQLPDLRPRVWTLGWLTADIQCALLEAANGISGLGMSGQISISSVLAAIVRARNRFVIDTHIPYSVHTITGPVPPDGLVSFPQSSVYVHRAMWQDAFSERWTNLWREDAWATDKASPQWTLNPGLPLTYSESEQSPLKLQLVPPPEGSGALEIVSVDSIAMDTTRSAALFGIPDEWIHAIKYGALSDLLSAESQNKDPLRAQYAEMRYGQAVDFCRQAKSVLRLAINRVPIALDSLAAIDASNPYWHNQVRTPLLAGTMYDFVSFDCVPDVMYNIAADVVAAAPLPQPGSTDFIQIGLEDIDSLLDYITHILAFKCGGNEFKATFSQYDDFMTAVSGRGAINKAKVRYLQPLFGVAQKEQAERPDKLAKDKASA